MFWKCRNNLTGPTAFNVGRNRSLQRREAVASAPTSGMCARSAAKRPRAFIMPRAARPSPPAHARWLCPLDVTLPGSIACLLPEMHPVFARVRRGWPRSGHMGLAMRRRRMASSAHTRPRFMCVFWRLDRIIRWSRASCSCRSHEQNPKKTRLPRSGTEVRRQLLHVQVRMYFPRRMSR